MYDLSCEFDLGKHMSIYKNYLEVVVRADGTVEYAVPSHQEKLIEIGRTQRGMSRQEFIESCPQSMWFDYLTWLIQQTGCVSVWSCGYKAEIITPAQREVLDMFIKEGVMTDGQIY